MHSNDYLALKLHRLREDEQRARTFNNQTLLDIMNEFHAERRVRRERRNRR